MTQPLLHPKTKQAIESYMNTPSHALILSGPQGIGKLHVATWIARSRNSEAVVIQPLPDKTTISIEQIRDLYTLTKTGTPMTIIIEDAHNMGEAAQNSFLKLLEEPPKNTWFILTYHDFKQVLPTISSRSQHINIIPPESHVMLEHAKAQNTSTEQVLKSVLHTTRGMPGSFFQITQDQTRLKDYLEHISTAKFFYSAPPYERHVMCIKHTYEKNWACQLLDTLAIIIESLIVSSSSDRTKLKKLRQQAEIIDSTTHNIVQINGNPKIHLARLSEEL